IITFISQRRTCGVFYQGEQAPWRVPLILWHNITFYLYKIVWPVDLSAYYAFPDPFSPAHPMVLAGIIGSIILITALLISWRWTRSALVGWLLFFVAILPTMGGVGFTRVIAADRYLYLPSLGVLIALAWLLWRLWSGGASKTIRRGPVIICVILITICEARAT